MDRHSKAARACTRLTFFFLLFPALLLFNSTLAAQVRKPAYVCPMHAEVKLPSPGKCPKCQMALRAATATTAPAADASQPSALSTQIPDTPIYNQAGQRLRFFTDLVKGKTVAINFIFTTCATICPPLTVTFRKVQQQLGARAGREVALISISVDPVTDTPERLRAFAAKFDAAPGWSFVTGSPAEIAQLLRALGAGVGDKNDHTQTILIGNEAAGYWTRANGLAAPAKLVAVINEAAAKKKPASIPADTDAKQLSPTASAAHYFPNLMLLTQDGKPVRFFDDLLKGKTVLINFMFATCAGACPVMTANLAKVQAHLDDRLGRDMHLISISVDPLVDTPEALKRYADNFKVRPGWYFLTGNKEDVAHVLRKLGSYVEDKAQHTNVLIIGNVTTGDWAKVPALSDAAEIAKLALKMADAKKE